MSTQDKLYRICLHWTAGTYKISPLELTRYHFIFDEAGSEFKGSRPPESNLHASVEAGTYQQHCGGGNTGCIGIAAAGMYGYGSPKNIGAFPLTEKQINAMCKKCVYLMEKYNINLNPVTVFTHYEFGLKNSDSPSAGKIDINFLPYKPELKPADVGNYLRKIILDLDTVH